MFYINDIRIGMVLIDYKNRKYVVIQTNLNGDDEYYSRIHIISEEEYLQNKGKTILESKLKTKEWIDRNEYYKEYRVCDEQYEVNSEKIFKF